MSRHAIESTRALIQFQCGIILREKAAAAVAAVAIAIELTK